MTFYHIYADESRQQAHPSMLFGLVLIPRDKLEQTLRDDYRNLRQRHRWGSGEFKWEKVSQGKLHVYKEFVDIFFDHEEAEFRCLIVDKSKIDYTKNHAGDHETAFYEFYYQAISRNLKHTDEYWIFADGRNNQRANRWEELKAKINDYWLLQGASGNIVRILEPRKSKEDDLLQITDVLLGAVGYDLENRVESAAKVELVRHIASRIGCERLGEHRSKSTPFTVWRFQFSEGQKEG